MSLNYHFVRKQKHTIIGCHMVSHTYEHTHTHTQYPRDRKDMVSEIAQCHFPVHYLLDGAVRRGMNDRSMCVSVTPRLLMKWENVFSQLFVLHALQYICTPVLLHWRHVTSTRPHRESLPPAVPSCSLSPDRVWSVQRIRACKTTLYAEQRDLKSKENTKEDKTKLFQTTETHTWHPFPAVLNAALTSIPWCFPKKHPVLLSLSEKKDFLSLILS